MIKDAMRMGSVSSVSPMLMVGFNRRFSPHIQKIKKMLSGIGGAHSFLMTVNAGLIERDHWIQNPDIGGGRVIGEACHFIDLLRFLSDSNIANYSSTFMQSESNDTVNIELKFENGSIGSIHYFSNGSKSFPKERLEIFSNGRVLQLDNFKKLKGFGWPGFKSMNLWRQDKGQNTCVKAFIDALRTGGTSPIPFDQIIEVAEVSINLASANLPNE
jgi:predicted dehydrogenase